LRTLDTAPSHHWFFPAAEGPYMKRHITTHCTRRPIGAWALVRDNGAVMSGLFMQRLFGNAERSPGHGDESS
jgi:hypothetical protein